uniref:Uncharacterized protein n=1 Tax=Phasianus colchicus TaxID=9054 RepID=A0A669PS22_PHACC
MLRSRRSPTRHRTHGYQPRHAPQSRTFRTGGNRTRSPAGRAAQEGRGAPRPQGRTSVPRIFRFYFPAHFQERTKSNNEKPFSGQAGQPLAYDQRLLPPRRRERGSRPPSATLFPARRRRHGPAAVPGLPKSRAPSVGNRERSRGRCVAEALRVRPGAAQAGDLAVLLLCLLLPKGRNTE